MQCTCGTGCCKPCSTAKGIVLIVLAVVYWAGWIQIDAFLSLLVIFAGLKALAGAKCGPKPTAPKKKKK